MKLVPNALWTKGEGKCPVCDTEGRASREVTINHVSADEEKEAHGEEVRVNGTFTDYPFQQSTLLGLSTLFINGQS